MRSSFCVASTVAVFLGCVLRMDAQSVGKRAPGLAQLELSIEVAATTDEGYPAALRVTVKNVGTLAVTMPVLGRGCHPDNGVHLESFWTSVDEKSGRGWGGGCATSDMPSLASRVKSDWVWLEPGEFMTTTLRLDLAGEKSGTVEYWVEYDPPDATVREIDDLLQAGYVIPTEKLATEHRRFQIH